ncbi:hypothetical protein FOZ62_014342, partial [Perkinsus olseni]
MPSSIRRFIKLPDRDVWLPCYVLKKDEAHQGLYVVVEIGHSTIASKLLGDDVSHHQIADNHYVGAWIHLSYKTGWRTSPATVPGGKALLGGSGLEDEQVTDDLIEAIEALEVPLPPPQLAVSIQMALAQAAVPSLLVVIYLLIKDQFLLVKSLLVVIYLLIKVQFLLAKSLLVVIYLLIKVQFLLAKSLLVVLYLLIKVQFLLAKSLLVVLYLFIKVPSPVAKFPS